MSESTRLLQEEAPLDADVHELFASLGARPVINAAGAYTVLGGSVLSPTVRAAMEAANRYFADMKGLLRSSGDVIAGMLGAEAAMVTSGGAAALVLGTAAILTRDHEDYLERLPDTRGIPNQLLTHLSTRQKYDHCVGIAGAKLVDFGGAGGATVAELEAAIGPETAGVHYLVPAYERHDLLPLETVIEVAHARGLPVLVDAAGLTYPVDNLRRYARIGADLVCYAGKYFDAPHSTGLLVGRRALIDGALVNSFVGFETSGYLTIGRPMKVDRQEVAAAVVALREWLAMDHEQRLSHYGERIDLIMTALRGLEGVEAYRISERDTPTPMVRDGVRLHLGSTARAETVVQALRDGDPCIWTRIDDRALDAINVSVAFCTDDEIALIARRLRDALSA